MFKWLKRRSSTFHVEYFRGQIGMCGYHDKQKFDNLKDVNKRLEELGVMDEETITAELGFVPSFMRVLQVTG